MKVSFSMQWIVVIFIIISALFTNVYIFFETIASPERLTPDISQYEKRFLTLRYVLPRRGVAGYVSDDIADEDISSATIYIARYSLSPVILVRSMDYPLIVGNFRNPAPDLEIYREKGLKPIKDFGNGVLLFEREH